jgi:hypothetical protein
VPHRVANWLLFLTCTLFLVAKDFGLNVRWLFPVAWISAIVTFVAHFVAMSKDDPKDRLY